MLSKLITFSKGSRFKRSTYFVTASRSKDQSGRQTEDVHNHWFFLRPIDNSMNERTNNFDYVTYRISGISVFYE